MSYTKCFDVASMVIEDATKRFEPQWKLNKENLEFFKEYCGAMDSLADEFNGETFCAEVDEVTMDITLTLECDEIIIESPKHILYELAKKAVKYSFSTSDNGKLIIEFVFPPLWNRV